MNEEKYYLKCTFRSRDDTVRQIVCNLTDDGSNELLDELQKGQPLLDDGCSSDDELDDWENWMPDPVDADPSKIHRTFQNCIYKKL